MPGKPGSPRRRSVCRQGDHAHDSRPHRGELRRLEIASVLPHRHDEHGSGLGQMRWVVERSVSWLHQFRRLSVRWERLADIHEVVISLACILSTCDFAVRLL